MTAIKIDHLTKVLKKHTVLDDITLELEENRIYGFAGQNGSGKTMLFRAVSGLIFPTSGTVEVFGRVIGKDVSFPESLGLVLENIGLYPQYSGFQNLKLLASIQKKITDGEIREAISRVGLDPADKRPVRKYSLGMKQRIALAQAIMEHPRLLILDEPTNALDESGVELVKAILREERDRGATVVLASHDGALLEDLAGEIFSLAAGRVTGSRPGKGGACP